MLELPRGAGLPGAGFTLAWCTKRFKQINLKLLHPDHRRLDEHASLLPRTDEFNRACQEFNSAWQTLRPLLEISEGVYQAPASPPPGDAHGTTGAVPPQSARSAGTGRGRRRSSAGGGDAGGTSPPPPPMPKTPVEIFLSIDVDSAADDLMPCVLSITSVARQRPRAKGRRYVELDERVRKEMALHIIDTATPHLLELAGMGRVGEFGYAREIGQKQRKHHGPMPAPASKNSSCFVRCLFSGGVCEGEGGAAAGAAAAGGCAGGEDGAAAAAGGETTTLRR